MENFPQTLARIIASILAFILLDAILIFFNVPEIPKWFIISVICSAILIIYPTKRK